MLPNMFNADGVLPQDYDATLDEIRQSILVSGSNPPSPGWDLKRRMMLVGNLSILVRELWNAGIGTVYADGSFVTNKDKPGDIDGYFECRLDDLRNGTLKERLNATAAIPIWSWHDRVIVTGYPTPKLRMWEAYRIELFPYTPERPTGVVEDGKLIPFPVAFRRIKYTNKPKGIIRFKKD
jgi:hypothetical protein